MKSNERFGKIAEEWKIFKENRDNNEPQVKNKSVAVVNNFMKVEEISPPSSDNEDEPKEQPKEPSEEPDEEAVEEPAAASLKKKKNSLRTLPPIKIPVK